MKKTKLLVLLSAAFLLVGCAIGQKQSNKQSSKQSDLTQSTSAESSSGGQSTGDFVFDDDQLNNPQEIHTVDQLSYLSFSRPYYSITGSDLNGFNATGASSLQKTSWAPKPITISWEYEPSTDAEVKNYSFIFGQESDLSDGFEIKNIKQKSVSFTNSFLGDNYFKVIAHLDDESEEESEINIFKVTEQAPRNLDVGNMPNVRDMGGRTTYSGAKIKQGLIYRGAGNKFDNRSQVDSDCENVLLNQLKIKTEINVANSTTNNLNFDGVKVENCYMDYGATPYSNLARNAEKIRQVMSVLSDESNYPVFYHCRIGTDRTGITGVMIGGLLGIKFNEIIQDYGYSNFAPIDNQRYPGKTPDNNGDDIKKYIDEILALPGANFQEQTYLALRMLGVPAAKLDTIINLMTEGTKATIPNSFKVGEGADLTSSATMTTSTDYKTPGTYYAVGSNGTISYKTTLTAGKKDVVVYLGYTGNVTTSTSTKLASSLTLKIDGAEKEISNTKNLWQAGFGSTQQDSRKGYMFNILGSYDFTAGEHTVEITSKSGTFNIATITVADRAA